jgi:hypothetical protein
MLWNTGFRGRCSRLFVGQVFDTSGLFSRWNTWNTGTPEK